MAEPDSGLLSLNTATVRAQWDLLCTTWNLTRIFARWQIDPGLLTRAATLG